MYAVRNVKFLATNIFTCLHIKGQGKVNHHGEAVRAVGVLEQLQVKVRGRGRDLGPARPGVGHVHEVLVVNRPNPLTPLPLKWPISSLAHPMAAHC